jgi:hypothetical protein
MGRPKRTMGILLVFGAALPLAVASVAWACGVLATVTLDKKVASPGEAVSITGKNYATTATGGPSAVTVRLQSRSGTVLTTVPAVAGRISDTFTVPSSVSPGWYVVLATQNNANGTPKSGTPGRTTLRIQGAAAGVVPAAAPWSRSTPSAPAGAHAPVGSGSGSPSPLMILLASALSLTMLLGGWKLLSRKSRAAAAEPQPVF